MVSWIEDRNTENPIKNVQPSIYEPNRGLDCAVEIIFQLLFKKFWGDMYDSRAGTGNMQDEPGTSCPTKK